jgi:hypothetical protein
MALVFTLAMTLAMTLAPVLASPAAAGERLVVGAFSAGDLAGWEVKSFKGLTDYTLVPDPTAEGGRTVLRAESRGAASGLFKEVKLDLRKYPLLRWSWRVEGTVAGGDESLKAGDDYAARVYVVFPHALFWRTRAINYIWANRLAKGAHQPNVFSAHAMMVAAESGDELAGRWVSEERDVVADYRLLFGEEPPALGAVAIMTDTDNTGGRAVAYYGDISLAARD